VISIDPGVKALGWASWGLYHLEACGCSRTAARKLTDAVQAHRAQVPAPECHADAVLESMAYRPHGSTPQDMIDVQTCGMAVAGLVSGRIHLYPASEWKGTIPKRVHHMRMRGALTPVEIEILDRALAACPESNRKEILDAVALGLYHLKRTDRAGSPKQ
jgi:hypothetical protein